MSLIGHRIVWITFSVGTMLAAGCQSAQPSPVTGIKPPPSPGDIKEARFLQAIEGLSFETGFVVVDPIGRRPNTRLASKHHAEGVAAYNQNRIIDAITLQNKAVRTDPTWGIAYNGLGRALLGEGEGELAAAAFRTALALDERYTEARFNLSYAVAGLGNQEEAIELMNGVVQAQPDNVEAHERLAIWNYYIGEYETAWSHVHRAQNLGHAMPPQFIVLLQKQAPES
jgi:Flp pilus assembly protein TadD